MLKIGTRLQMINTLIMCLCIITNVFKNMFDVYRKTYIKYLQLQIFIKSKLTFSLLLDFPCLFPMSPITIVLTKNQITNVVDFKTTNSFFSGQID